MNARALCLFCVAASFVLVPARPGRSAPAPANAKGRSPFAGSYTGIFTAMTLRGDTVGEATLTVDNDGNVKGEVVNKTANLTATLKGSINKDGKASIEFEYPGQTATAFGTVVK